MKNINVLKKAISVILVALMLASAFAMTGCTSDPHAGHDHGNEGAADLSILISHSKLSFADNYPTVSLYDTAEVKQTKNTSGSVVLRVAKKEGDQVYCTAGNTSTVNYIVVGLPVEAEVDEYILCNTESYTITAERFGFTDDPVFGILYVIYGSDMQNTEKLSMEKAAKLFASIPSVPSNPSNPSDDSHEGHDH